MRASFLLEIVLPVLLLCWAAALAYSAALSDTGYSALATLEEKVAQESAAYETLRDRRIALERRADLLSSRSLDPDLVDERIRMLLGYSKEGDIVIPRRELDRLLAQPTVKTR